MIRAIIWVVFNGIICFGGALTGYYRKADDAIPNLDVDTRDIPDAPYHTRFFLIAPLSGLIQFLAIYTELSYLVESIFMSQIYDMFFFLFLSSCVQVIVIWFLSRTQILHQFGYTNFEWWWRTFWIGH